MAYNRGSTTNSFGLKKKTFVFQSYFALATLYFGSSADPTACTLCPGGLTPNFINKTFVANDGRNMTCASAISYAALEGEGSDKCYDWQVDGIKHCGCPVEDNMCNLCPHMADHTNLATSGNMTCNKAFVLASQIAYYDSQCLNYQAMGLNECQCEVAADFCTLCPDGSPSNNSFIPDHNISCAQATVYATYSNKTSGDDCTGFNFLGMKYCGCPIPEDSCTLCPDGKFPSKPDARFNTDENNTEGTLCSDAHYYFPLYPSSSEQCMEGQSGQGILQCGCDLLPSKCTICPVGERVPEHMRDVKSPFPYANATCAELEAYGNMRESNSSDCQVAIDTSRSFCCNSPSPSPVFTESPKQSKSSKQSKGNKQSNAPSYSSTKSPKGSKSSKAPTNTSPISPKSSKEPKGSNAPTNSKSPISSKSSQEPKSVKEISGKSTKAPKVTKQENYVQAKEPTLAMVIEYAELSKNDKGPKF